MSESTTYELLAQAMYQSILSAEGIENIDVRHNVDIAGKSGVEHQIDVHWKFRQAGIEHTVLVECKHYSSTVELGHVRNFFGVVHDIGARGVMVTTVGFQSGAKEFADFYGINLKLLRTPAAKDWEGRIRDIHINVVMRFVDPHKPISVNFAVPESEKEKIEGASLETEPLETVLVDESGNQITDEFRHWLPSKLPALELEQGGPYEHEIPVSNAFVRMRKPKGETVLVKVEKLHTSYYVCEAGEEISIMGDETVRAILRDFSSGQWDHVLKYKSGIDGKFPT